VGEKMKRFLLAFAAIALVACGSPVNSAKKVVYLDSQGHQIAVKEGASGLLLRKAMAGTTSSLLIYAYRQGEAVKQDTISFDTYAVYELDPGAYDLYLQSTINGLWCNATIKVEVLPHQITPVDVVLECPREQSSGIGMSITAVTNVPTWYFLATTDAPDGLIPNSGTIKVLKFHILQDMGDVRSLWNLQFQVEYTLGHVPTVTSCDLVIDSVLFVTMIVLADWYVEGNWQYGVVSTPEFDLQVGPNGVLAELSCNFESIPSQTVLRFKQTGFGAVGNNRIGNWLIGNQLYAQ